MSRAVPGATAISCLILAAAIVGCSSAKTVTISTRPPDAIIKVNGLPRGRGPIEERFTFAYPGETHYVIATRPGYRPSREVRITSDFAKDNLVLELKPATRVVTFKVVPVPAVVSLNGQPLTTQPASEIRRELEGPADPSKTVSGFVVTAEREGYEPARRTISWTDPADEYTLELTPLRDAARATLGLTITTAPPGAEVFVNDEYRGNTGDGPVKIENFAPRPDPATGQPRPLTVRAEKAGYEPVTEQVAAGDRRNEIVLQLLPRAKTVRVIPDPPGATVEITGPDGRRVDVKQEGGETGASTARLVYAPLDEKGTMPTYKAVVTHKSDEQEWEPAELTIDWNLGQNEYPVTLKPKPAVVRTLEVPLIRVTPVRGEDGAWRMTAERIATQAGRETGEGGEAPSASQVTQLPVGTALGSFAPSPDGTQVLFAALTADQPESPRGRLFLAPADGSGVPTPLTDGSRLDLTPAFTPDGGQIVFASDRADDRAGLGVFSLPADGAGDPAPVTSAEGAADLWPSVDASPRPRVFFQSFSTGADGPALFVSPAEGGPRTDLNVKGATQPQVGPKADTVLYAAADPTTGKRDLFRVSDQGGAAVNLTNTPDVDEFDAVWSMDGRRVAFTSDRAATPDRPHNYDVWVMDVAGPQNPLQVTRNESWDDNPAFDGTGQFLYFRSNRGGAWQVWKIPLPGKSD